MTYAIDQALAYLASLPNEPASNPKVDAEIDAFAAEQRGDVATAKRKLLEAIQKYRDFPMKGYALDRLAGIAR
jgi:hypothetical protein